jgi:hypothetical protein
MPTQTSNQNISTVDRVVAITLAAFSMFVVGYTATRVYLSQSESQNVTSNNNAESIIPHQATLWSAFGK